MGMSTPESARKDVGVSGGVDGRRASVVHVDDLGRCGVGDARGAFWVGTGDAQERRGRRVFGMESR